MVAMRKRWLVFVTILTIILALSSCSKPPAPLPPPPTPGPTPTPVPVPTPPPTPTPPEVKEGLAILSHSSYVDNFGYFHLVGEVENVRSQNTEMNEVIATFFDDEGNVAVTATNYTYLDILIPGGKSPFEIILSSPPPVTNYKLETTWQVTTREPYTDLKIEGITLEREEQGGNLSGQVNNTGSETVDVIIVAVTLYDRDKKVAGVSFSFAEISPLNPGESSPFAIIINPQVASVVETYAIQAEGYRGE